MSIVIKSTFFMVTSDNTELRKNKRDVTMNKSNAPMVRYRVKKKMSGNRIYQIWRENHLSLSRSWNEMGETVIFWGYGLVYFGMQKISPHLEEVLGRATRLGKS